MKRIIVIALITFFSVTFQSVALANITILSVGDSITSGLKLNGSRTYWYCPANGVQTSSFYSCNGNGALNRGGFQPSVKSQLAQKNVNSSIYNWGFAGEESWEIYARVVNAMKTRNADYVFILAGVNDLNNNVSPQTTAFYVTSAIDVVIEEGLIPVVGTITPHSRRSSYNPKIQLINSLIRSEATKRKVAVAEHYQALISNWTAYNSGDGLHVGNSGDVVMAREWVKAYEESLILNKVTITITPILQLLLD